MHAMSNAQCQKQTAQFYLRKAVWHAVVSCMHACHLRKAVWHESLKPVMTQIKKLLVYWREDTCHDLRCQIQLLQMSNLAIYHTDRIAFIISIISFSL